MKNNHENTLNIALHMVATPLNVLSLMMLMVQMSHSFWMCGITVVYITSLPIPNTSTRIVSAAMASSLAATATITAHMCTPLQSIQLFLGTYVLHEMAHIITCEPTHDQSVYEAIPIVVDALIHKVYAFPVHDILNCCATTIRMWY